MADHANAKVVRDAYAAFGKGDLQAAAASFADDIVWHVGGNSLLAGDYKGQEEIFGFFGKLAEQSSGTFTLDVHDVVANDEHAVALVHASGEHGGKRLDQNAVHVFHVSDGKVKEFWGFPEDERATDEFWS